MFVKMMPLRRQSHTEADPRANAQRGLGLAFEESRHAHRRFNAPMLDRGLSHPIRFESLLADRLDDSLAHRKGEGDIRVLGFDFVELVQERPTVVRTFSDWGTQIVDE